MGEAAPLKIKLVSWGDPHDTHGRRFWGLRINGAYLGKPGKPSLWATREGALQAKRRIEENHGQAAVGSSNLTRDA